MDPYSQSNASWTWFISEVFLFLDILFTSSVVYLFNNDILAEFYVFMQVVYLTDICFRWLVKPDIPIANLVMQFNRAFGALIFCKKLDNIKLKQGTWIKDTMRYIYIIWINKHWYVSKNKVKASNRFGLGVSFGPIPHFLSKIQIYTIGLHNLT